MSNETVHSGCTDQTQATARLVIVLERSRTQKIGAGDNTLPNGKGHFGQRATFKAGPEYSGRTKAKWSVLFAVSTEISGISG